MPTSVFAYDCQLTFSMLVLFCSQDEILARYVSFGQVYPVLLFIDQGLFDDGQAFRISVQLYFVFFTL